MGPSTLFNMDEPERSTEDISRWWTERWLQKRIESDDVLAQVEQHTLSDPYATGRESNSPAQDDGQATLFDDLAY